MEKLNPDKKTLRKFGITMSVAFLVIAVIAAFRQRQSPAAWYILSCIFFAFGILIPSSLRFIYIVWMKFAFILGWLNTRLVLIIVFYLLFTPIGIVLKVFKADLLDREFKDQKDSYWRKRKEAEGTRLNLKRQF